MSKIFRQSVTIILLAYIFLPMITLADHVSGHGSFVDDAATNEVTKVTLVNPLNNITSIEGLLVAILNIFIVLMIPVIVFFIILSGFKYVMAQGNASKIEEATRSLTYAIIGGVLILGAVAIAEIIKNTVQAF